MSSFLQTGYNFLSDDEKEKTLEAMLESIVTENNGEKVTISNATSTDFGKKPLTLTVGLNTPQFCQKAGNKLMFKVGDLIGEQSEMYNEKPRVQPIENDFNRSFYRSIEIELPEDYKVTNLDKLNFDVALEDGTAQFVSTYKLEGTKLVISIDEYYNRIHYSVEEYEPYKEVINAAADFNKVVLYLAKK